jgi:phenylpyruvate tautomerase PptA (4-oxalocrotonate tautomerase family)
MPLRLSAEGQQVFDKWRKQRCKSREDEQLIAQLLRDVASDDWETHWFSYKDPSVQGITMLAARPGLFVHLRLWTGDAAEFTIVSISDVPPEAWMQPPSG